MKLLTALLFTALMVGCKEKSETFHIKVVLFSGCEYCIHYTNSSTWKDIKETADFSGTTNRPDFWMFTKTGTQSEMVALAKSFTTYADAEKYNKKVSDEMGGLDKYYKDNPGVFKKDSLCTTTKIIIK